jgi:hypothetical protein
VSTTGFANTDTVTQGAASGTITTLNSTTLVITGVSGTFNANATVITNGSTGTTTITNVSNTSIYRLTGLTSNSNIDITDVDDTTTEVVTARGRVDSFNANILEVRRITLFAEFTANATNRITGVTSAANDVITSVSYANTLSVGLNANVQANVTTSTGSLTGIDIISSGFGYVQDEAINIVSRDGTRTATGKAVIRNQGREEGRYTSYDGFPDSYRYIHDGEYYQEYSYEVNTSIPFDRYKDLLREVLHVAGTKMFGKFNSDTTVNNTITVSRSSITY